MSSPHAIYSIEDDLRSNSCIFISGFGRKAIPVNEEEETERGNFPILLICLFRNDLVSLILHY
jgi:hypothetical protein